MVNDFIQRLHATGTIVFNGLVREFVESSGVNVGINLGIPLFIEVVLQPVGDLSRVVQRNCLQSLFDFSNRAHKFNYPPNAASRKRVFPARGFRHRVRHSAIGV